MAVNEEVYVEDRRVMKNRRQSMHNKRIIGGEAKWP